MTVKEFVEACGKVTSEEIKGKILDKINIETYLPVTVKRQYIDEVLLSNLIQEEDGIAKIDTIDKLVCFFMVAVTAYTDLESEDMYSDYDSLSSTGLINEIFDRIGDDFSNFSMMFDMRCNEELEYRNSPASVINGYLKGVAFSAETFLNTASELLTKIDVKQILSLIK